MGSAVRLRRTAPYSSTSASPCWRTSARGASEGTVCCLPDPQCGTGTCVVNATGKISGVLTLIVDDDVSQLTGATLPGRRLKALTVIFEAKGKTGVVAAQTFQRLQGNTLDDFLTGLEQGTPDEFGLAVDETLMKLNTDTTGTGVPLDVTWLIYRTLDPETLVRMRTSAGLAPKHLRSSSWCSRRS